MSDREIVVVVRGKEWEDVQLASISVPVPAKGSVVKRVRRLAHSPSTRAGVGPAYCAICAGVQSASAIREGSV